MYVNVVSLKVTLKLQSGGDHLGEHEKKDRKIPEETICILTFVQETGRKVNKTDRNSPSKDQFQSGRTSLDQGNLDQRKNIEMNRFQNSPEDRRKIKRVQHSPDFFPHNPAFTVSLQTNSSLALIRCTVSLQVWPCIYTPLPCLQSLIGLMPEQPARRSIQARLFLF